ncbi:MAG: hypothetical protein U0795_14065 [Pirellulales bacterium]
MMVNRRRFLGQAGMAAGAGMLAGAWPATRSVAAAAGGKPRIAAIVTEYRGYSHADVILGRMLQGYVLDLTETYWPRTQVVSMYVDQFPQGDLSRGMASQYGATIYESISQAMTCGTDQLAVDGVLIIGEHGDYPHNAKGQHMYPRRRFFEEAVKSFRAAGRGVPVFNDKHLGYAWEDAKWMYDQSRELKFPLMAGSSLPTTWRRPDLDLPLGVALGDALAIGYGGLEAYGFHALETLQCMIERRGEGESGVQAVTCLEGAEVWRAAEQGRWSRSLLDAVLECVENRPTARPEDACREPAVYLIEHVDGFKSAVVMLDGYVGSFGFAGQVQGADRPVAAQFWLQEPEFSHFSYLTHNIESMYLTGQAPYPVERTLLTTGILDAVMTSRAEGHRRVETPWLADVKYRVTEDNWRRAKAG